MDLWRLDATALAELTLRGEVSSREVVTACLARMDVVNDRINAVVRRMDDEALAAADACDAALRGGSVLGSLHGVPVTIKINIDQRGHPTDQGARALETLIAPDDAPVVANLRRSGAIFVGRTNAPAFAMRMMSDNDLHGRTLNPLDRAIAPGGSSGGAAAAIAVGIGPIAIGNDMGGSVRVPASCNGIVGLRTGFGRVPSFSTTSTLPRSIGAQLMATPGPLTRTVRDARLAFAVMAQGDPRDTRWVDVPLRGPSPAQPIRVALVSTPPGGATHPAQIEAVCTAGRHLASAGYVVDEIAPPEIERVIDLYHVIVSGDVLRTLGPVIEQGGDQAAITALRHRMELHPPPDADAVLDALAERDRLVRAWQTFFLNWPLVVLPTLCDLPPPQDEDQTPDGARAVLESARTCLISSVLGLCGLAMPIGYYRGLRTGIQIISPRFREDLALDAAEVIENAQGAVAPVDPRW
jgi:amidase